MRIRWSLLFIVSSFRPRGDLGKTQACDNFHAVRIYAHKYIKHEMGIEKAHILYCDMTINSQYVAGLHLITELLTIFAE